MTHNFLRCKAHELTLPVQRHAAQIAVTVLRHDDLGLVFVHVFGRSRFVRVVCVSVQEQHDVGILLDGAGISKVRKYRAVLLSLFTRTGKLRQCHNRDIQLFRHDLEASRDLGNFLHAVINALCTVHQL